MKKILLSAVSLLLLVSCSNDESNTSSESTATAHRHRGCASHEVHEQQLRENPELAAKMQEIENFTQNAITSCCKRTIQNHC